MTMKDAEIFSPRSGRSRYAVLQWVFWQMANLGPMLGNANHFKNYAKHLVDDPRQLDRKRLQLGFGKPDSGQRGNVRHIGFIQCHDPTP